MLVCPVEVATAWHPERLATMTAQYRRGLAWGRHRDNGIWLASTSKRRLLWRGHDSLYVALGRFRLRLIKPWVYRGVVR